MEIKLKIFNSPEAEKLAGKPLNHLELNVLNILAIRQNKGQFVSSAELQDVIRSRKTTYKEILTSLWSHKIIVNRSGYNFIEPFHKDNRCRYFLLNPLVLKEVLSKAYPVAKAIALDLTPIQGLEDNSIISDDVTAATFRNLEKLTLDISKMENALIEMDTYLILRKFISKIKSVKKSKRTGRITHLLLQAGSKALREFLLINGRKPVDFDMVSAHWQFIAQKLAPEDTAKLTEWLTTGFYERVMVGTGIKNRKIIKGMIQQVLTNKRIHPTARKIRDFIFAELSSLKPYCQSVWKQGNTVQCVLQRMESTLINNICQKLDMQGRWFIPFYDGIWIEEESVELLKHLFWNYKFERK